jgi:RimJ/RimL family protein N-acetyltransferase
MARAYWGKGYMNEPLKALVSHAFEVLALRRLEADVDPRNAAPIYGLLRREWLQE